jgi:hypothetical protein
MEARLDEAAALRELLPPRLLLPPLPPDKPESPAPPAPPAATAPTMEPAAMEP